MKRVFIIHGWGGAPEGWLLDLKAAFEKLCFVAVAPQMPDTENPRIESWVPFLSELVGTPDEETYFVGHSIGCQTIMRYLESIDPRKVGGAFFVAGWFNLMNLEGPEEDEIERPWISSPVDFEKIMRVTQNLTALFSDDDPVVPLSDKEIFAEKLQAKIIVKHSKEHFNDDGSVDLEEILAMVKN